MNTLSFRPCGAWSRRIPSLLFALGVLACLCVPARGASPSADPAPAGATAVQPPTLEVFVREGCPHCAEAEAFLARLGRERPELQIVIRDVSREPAALERLKEIAAAQVGVVARVPAVYVGGQLIVGYSKDAGTDRLIRAALDAARPGAAATVATVVDGSPDASSCEAEDSLSCARPPDLAVAAPEQETFSVEFLGRTVTLDDVGLPAFTLAMGLLDGFNPCSMWVLILMISLLAPMNDRRRMIAIGGTFVLVQGVAYFLFMTAWLNLFLLIGLSRTSQLVIALVAIVAGAINLKDAAGVKGGVSLSISDRAKPGIYARMRGLLHAPTMGAAIVGAFVLAVLVQIVEFMCTSGFPALFTRILTLNQLDRASYYGYLLLYNAAYMLDDIFVLTIGVVTLSRHRLQEKEGRILKLVSGVVMVGLGIYLILDR